MYRQGDVLIVPVTEIPVGVTPATRDEGRIVLAYGEVTGHAHVVTGPAELYDADRGERYLEVGAGATVVHEEHAAIPLPEGTYRVVRQREYSPEAIRPVLD